MYFLARISTFRENDNYYSLVKANNKDEAYKKVKDKFGKHLFIKILETIE